jgi:hypothetical protein
VERDIRVVESVDVLIGHGAFRGVMEGWQRRFGARSAVC